MQHSHDLRLYLINTFAFIVSLSQVETALRFLLLILSIIYTINQLIEIVQKRKLNKKNHEANSKKNT